MSLSCSTFSDSRYFLEPTVPSSSAPQNANRTAFFTCGAEPSCVAVSRTAATPEPLSLMPGPSGTLSRWAPTTTTSCGGSGLGLGDHVAGVDGLGVGLDHDPGRAGLGAQPGAVGLGHPDRRDLDVGVLTEGGAHVLLVDVVGDDHRDPAQLGDDRLLVREGAAAAVDQHHRAAHRQPVVVGRCAARGLVGGCGDQRSADPLGRGAEAELDGAGLDGRRRRRSSPSCRSGRSGW